MARIDGESRNEGLDQCVLNWVKTLRFRSDSPRRGVYVSTLINASLIPPPPKYVPGNGVRFIYMRRSGHPQFGINSGWTHRCTLLAAAF